ncbi:hypothetical protein SAMN05444392_11323 [Seinonella peptonophila]|uniref:Major Facilitator Superfamily protein n=1 Tax=Seinonella peptonophila TaxID=112248 RepID=A0A1M5ABY2_9BACL|nr:hypothetical protein [Seinonella peptonophila]SHF27810.1 hypothetical protein SAMN05444392_11323 [Seinonella peptonophila]
MRKTDSLQWLPATVLRGILTNSFLAFLLTNLLIGVNLYIRHRYGMNWVFIIAIIFCVFGLFGNLSINWLLRRGVYIETLVRISLIIIILIISIIWTCIRLESDVVLYAFVCFAFFHQISMVTIQSKWRSDLAPSHQSVIHRRAGALVSTANYFASAVGSLLAGWLEIKAVSWYLFILCLFGLIIVLSSNRSNLDRLKVETRKHPMEVRVLIAIWPYIFVIIGSSMMFTLLPIQFGSSKIFGSNAGAVIIFISQSLTALSTIVVIKWAKWIGDRGDFIFSLLSLFLAGVSFMFYTRGYTFLCAIGGILFGLSTTAGQVGFQQLALKTSKDWGRGTAEYMGIIQLGQLLGNLLTILIAIQLFHVFSIWMIPMLGCLIGFCFGVIRRDLITEYKKQG